MATKTGLALPKDFRQGKTMWRVSSIADVGSGMNEVQVPVAVRITDRIRPRIINGERFVDQFTYVASGKNQTIEYGAVNTDFPVNGSLEEQDWFFDTKNAAIKFTRRLMHVQGYDSSVALSWKLAARWQGPGQHGPVKAQFTEQYTARVRDFFKGWCDLLSAPANPDLITSIAMQESGEVAKGNLASAKGQYVIGIDPAGDATSGTVAMRTLVKPDGTFDILGFDKVDPNNGIYGAFSIRPTTPSPQKKDVPIKPIPLINLEGEE